MKLFLNLWECENIRKFAIVLKPLILHIMIKKTIFMGLVTIVAASCQSQKAQESVASEPCCATDSCCNTVIETIMARHSVRAYTDQPVDRCKLEKIVECGINAPSGMNQQPWQVRVVDSPEYINGITEIFLASSPQVEPSKDPNFKNMFRNAPAVIFIASPKNGTGQLDCGMLGENMILAAQSMSLGTCPLGGPIAFMKSNPDAAPYLEKLNIPEDYELLYAIAVGYPDENPEAKPRDSSKVQFVE